MLGRLRVNYERFARSGAGKEPLRIEANFGMEAGDDFQPMQGIHAFSARGG
jgi:hypothetical protein